MASRVRIQMTARDSIPELNMELLDENDVAVDLSTYTNIWLHIELPDDAGITTIAKTDVDLVNGLFKFVFTTGSLVAGAGQNAEVEFEDASGNELRTQLIFDVEPFLSNS